MTITTTQYQTVRQAVYALMEGEALNNTFDFQADNIANLSVDTLTEVLNNRVLLCDSFGLDVNSDSFEVDFEYALLTLERVAENIVESYSLEIFEELSGYYDFEETLEILESENITVYFDMYTMADVAEYILEESGDLTYYASRYTDRDALLHDLYCGGDIQDYYYDTVYHQALEEGLEAEEARQVADDYEITEENERDYIEMVIDCMDDKFLSRYFDYEQYGHDMDIEGEFYTTNSGIFEVIQ